MDLGLRGKRALVMGASSGLGFAIAKKLASEGARVAICSRDQGRIQAAAKKIGAELAIAADLTVPGAAKSLVGRLNDQWGGVDVLVINTGGPPKGGILQLTPEMWTQAFQNLW